MIVLAPIGQKMVESPTNLALADFKLVDPLGRVLNVTADGVVTLPIGKWGHIEPDGRVTDAKGNLRARLSAGRVIDTSDQAFALLAEDGTATVGGKEFRFDGEGKLALGNNPIMLQPADSPARRIAMLVVIIALLRPSPDDIHLTPKMDLKIRVPTN